MWLHMHVKHNVTLTACDGVQCATDNPSAYTNWYTNGAAKVFTGANGTAFACAVVSLYDLNCNLNPNVTLMFESYYIITASVHYLSHDIIAEWPTTA